jgi:arylsulfatase A-like enzyme
MSEMDVLPTLVKLAGGEVPGDRVIDGRDIWPLLSGRSKQSPHEALFYFKSNRLEAVRSGPWKLAVVEQVEDGIDKPKKPFTKPFVPKLFNLDADIGETTDVAAQHPDVVQRLQGYLQQIDKDLGVTGRGPGVRAGGMVNQPQPLLLRNAMEYD